MAQPEGVQPGNRREGAGRNAVSTPPGWASSILVVVVATALLLTGCSREVTGTAVRAFDSGSGALPSGAGPCTRVEAPLTDIPSAGKAEPQLRIPVPAGWKRDTRMNNRIIRFAIVATDLATGGFAPNAVVTLESVRGSRDAGELFEENRSNLVTLLRAFDLTTEVNTTCGLPSETTDYTAPAAGPAPERPITMHAVVADTGRDTYLATLTVQTADAENPNYQRDAQEIIDGFQVLPPSR
ncbi:MAG: LpqN/LpqT family lipoprotein [Actinomycetia bacterium]|nr:LpqN/LpqT family lipoprotein [Actinomycetes bacterium]MCH9703028.1 LpqN/LpqT family lipoprotein [Actinomycetes bacterium]MCH9760106.1 LpqN/LpqT family lipoprotein [Actinomycetes bacterium]